MRILHCIVRMGVGGAERQLVYLSGALVRGGADVHVVTVYAAALDGPLAASGATMHRVTTASKYDPLLPLRLARVMRRLRPHVVTTWLTQMDILAGTAARMLSIPFVLNERSTEGSYPPSALHRVRRWSGTGADAIVANSEEGRDYWKQCIPSDRIEVIPNIVPQSEIDAAPQWTGDLPEDEDVILHVGRLGPEKNIDKLLQALALVMKRRRVRALICGDGTLRSRAETTARMLGIADRTIFAGQVTDVWSRMKRANVVVAVGAFEGNPNVVLEAMACGTPLVVSDIAGHRALLDERSAWLVDPRSEQSIADGLLAALGGRTEANERAARARTALQSRAPQDIAARHEEIYRRVAKGRN
jgi:glycosyltransferase involved in cell wall biosynthesis